MTDEETLELVKELREARREYKASILTQNNYLIDMASDKVRHLRDKLELGE